MKTYKKIYLPYRAIKKIDYIFLLYLYSIAASEDNIRSLITFSSYQKLADTINDKNKIYQKKEEKVLISAEKLRYCLNKQDIYSDFFYFQKKDAENKEYSILLYNDFRKGGSGKPPFVCLAPTMIQLLLEQQDNLLAHYLVYMVYYCGISQNNTDFTAKQFLDAIGYSTRSNDTYAKISRYNKILREAGIITVQEKIVDGKYRNTYSLLQDGISQHKIIIYDKPEGFSRNNNFVF